MRTFLTIALLFIIQLGYGQYRKDENFELTRVKSNVNDRLYKKIGFKNITNVILSENQRESFMGRKVNMLSEMIEDDVLKVTYSHEEDENTMIFNTNIKNVYIIKLHSKIKVVFILHIQFKDGSDEHYSFIENDTQIILFKKHHNK